MIVPTPWLSTIVAPTGLERLTTNVSLLSDVVSSEVVTSIVCVVWPGEKGTAQLRPVCQDNPECQLALATRPRHLVWVHEWLTDCDTPHKSGIRRCRQGTSTGCPARGRGCQQRLAPQSLQAGMR